MGRSDSRPRPKWRAGRPAGPLFCPGRQSRPQPRQPLLGFRRPRRDYGPSDFNLLVGASHLRGLLRPRHLERPARHRSDFYASFQPDPLAPHVSPGSLTGAQKFRWRFAALSLTIPNTSIRAHFVIPAVIRVSNENVCRTQHTFRTGGPRAAATFRRSAAQPLLDLDSQTDRLSFGAVLAGEHRNFAADHPHPAATANHREAPNGFRPARGSRALRFQPLGGPYAGSTTGNFRRGSPLRPRVFPPR